MKKIILLLFVCILVSCGSVQKKTTTKDSDYGFIENQPIKLGGFMRETKYAGYHRKFFSSLIGPEGQRVQSRRLGRCCAFRDGRLAFGTGFLDKYELSYNGLGKPVVVYVDLYNFDRPRAPSGFKLKE